MRAAVYDSKMPDGRFRSRRRAVGRHAGKVDFEVNAALSFRGWDHLAGAGRGARNVFSLLVGDKGAAGGLSVHLQRYNGLIFQAAIPDDSFASISIKAGRLS